MRLSGALFFAIAVLMIVLSSYQEEKLQPSQLIEDQLKVSIRKFEKNAIKLQELSQNFQSKEELISNYKGVRNDYKSIEFLVAYLQPQFVNDKINGAPLPKLERKVAELVVIQPTGLQVLDEILFEETLDTNSLIDVNKKLVSNWYKLKLFMNQVELTDRHVFEAVRSNLIRTYTLGVTGFDTPGSLNALPDALVAMKSMNISMLSYSDDLKKVNKKLERKLFETFESSVKFLEKNQDFDDFNRLTFLTEYINPLYALVLDAQLALNIETIDEVVFYKKSINNSAKNLFSEDFLNPLFFTNLQEKQYSEEMVDLGKTLFFDPILSSNGKRSCASCHNPQKAFTDGIAKSLAMDFEGTVARNAPTLINAVYADRYFHDLRASKLEEQFEHVVVNDKEFHTDYREIQSKLAQSDSYQQKFKSLFPEYRKPIFKYTLSMALSAYIVSLQGLNSPFDKYVRGESNELSESAKRGYNIFMGRANCGTCHFAPMFNGSVPPLYVESESEVLGVPENADRNNAKLDPDHGRAAAKVLKEESKIYDHSFKTVTVRNIELTAPYMHNGVYQTLEEVIEFYNAGGGAALGFDLENQTLGADSLHLSAQDKQDLIAFMKSLTDTSGTTTIPVQLPQFETMNSWNNRKIGGEY